MKKKWKYFLLDNMDICNRLVYRVRGGTEKRPQRKITSENKQIILRIRNSKNTTRPWPQQRVERHASFRQGFNCLALKVIQTTFLAQTTSFLLWIWTKKHFSVKQPRNQELRAKTNHLFLQMKRGYSLCENRVVASHKLQAVLTSKYRTHLRADDPIHSLRHFPNHQ